MRKVIIILIIVISLISIFFIYKNNEEKRRQERYAEIKENVKKGIEWHIKASSPYCKLVDYFDDDFEVYSYSNSSFYINNGYIKEKDLLDIDNESYCDIYVENYENSYDDKKDCEMNYKLYLKCKDYEEEGYFYWGK